MSISTRDTLHLRDILLNQAQNEKHRGYHILPERFLQALAGSHENTYTFYERERFRYFCQHVDFQGKSVIDIGCNIGYFLFSALDRGASRVTGYEGKASCGAFLHAAIEAAAAGDRFSFFDEYYRFNTPAEPHDIGILLNVLHHLGDDYGNATDMASARQQMLQQLNGLSASVSTLIFQMGFNWKGDRNACLFDRGTKAEMIDFVQTGTRGRWAVRSIGIAQRDAGGVQYRPVDESNIARDDSLGEFLNRPIFILDSMARP